MVQHFCKHPTDILQIHTTYIYIYITFCGPLGERLPCSPFSLCYPYLNFMFSFLGTMNSYGIDQSCILQRIANCAWKHYQNAPSRRKTTVSRIFKKWRRPPLYDQAHSTLYTREKILLAAAAAAAAALPARTPPRRVCSIPSPTAPRAAFHTIFVFLQSAHMSENRSNQVSIVFLNKKQLKTIKNLNENCI